MITHVVLFRLKDRSPESVARAREVLLSMEGRIPQLRSLQAGADVLHTERSFDLCLIARFNSLEDLQAYQDHPVHQEAVAYMNQVRDATVTVDYETN